MLWGFAIPSNQAVVHSAGYAHPPLGVPADMLSAVKKCPNLFMLWGFAIPSNQAVTGIRKTALCIIRRKGKIT